jgi:hypothetical protein
MTWREFRKWVADESGYVMGRVPRGADWLRLWSSKQSNIGDARTGTGSGRPAEYGITQQRRFVAWFRLHGLIEKVHIASWLDAAEIHDDGWLVNDGSGIRWVADP